MPKRTGFHGLPAEYATPEGGIEKWDAVVGYLRALEKSRRPIVIAITDARQEDLSFGHEARLNQQIGFLRVLPNLEERPLVHRLRLDWPEPDQICGVYTVDERLLDRASLHTNDGDDYFGLRLDLGPVALVLMDANTNMDSAYEQWKERYQQTYLALPSAAEIEQKWQAEPDPDRLAAIRQEMKELRAELVDRGASVAEEMSDVEIAAAAERVAWALRMSGRMLNVPHADWRTLWLDEFADSLRGSASGG